MVLVKDQLEDLMKDKHKMVSEFMVLFNAGTDTTSHVIQQILMNLQTYPEVKAKLVKEIEENIINPWDFSHEDITKCKYLEAVIKESLRMNTPAPGLNPREMKNKTQDILLDDLLVKTGT